MDGKEVFACHGVTSVDNSLPVVDEETLYPALPHKVSRGAPSSATRD
ncbi:hypothetical protein OH799_00270 [Nocardia sp. NBC_00881]|nr:hypothetical protein OH799_00270 [Nocardia sp. NBC_00881]